MSTKQQLVRLLAAVAIAVISCRFVTAYNVAALLSHERGRSLPAFTDAVVQYAAYAYVVPVAVLLLGLMLLRSTKDRRVMFECLIALAWILAFSWVLIALNSWQWTHVELFSGPYR